MRSVHFAYTVFLVLVIFIFINCFALSNIIDEITELTVSAEENDLALAKQVYEEIYETYKSHRLFMSLSVDHNDLSDIESSFSEIIGAAKADDAAGVMTAKSRLINRLRHIKRLSGINIESVF